MIVLVTADGREGTLQGDASEYRSLADALRSGAGTISLSGQVDATPYDSELTTIEIATRPAVGVTITPDPEKRVLYISGDAGKLAILADIVSDSAALEATGGHVHIEHYEDHPYLAASSMPLVLADPTS